MIAYFKTAKNLWEAEIVELIQVGLNEEIAHEFLNWRDNFDIEKTQKELEKNKIKTICFDEPQYPKLLKEIDDPPICLFYRGEIPKDSAPCLGVVGTRKNSSYAKVACEELVEQLSNKNVVIVSGLAFGIDSIAHSATIKKQGLTVAVLGSGVNDKNIMPRNNLGLARDIINSGGAVISEYPPGFEASKITFPARNRIIAGLSLGTLVIEAPEKSGSLITAKFALEYNREVFAIPHSINSKLGIGNNNLLKMGAAPVTDADDIVDALNLNQLRLPKSNTCIQLPTIQAKIYSCLNKNPKHINLIIKETGLTSSQVGSELILMEINGLIKNLGNNNYIAK